MAKKAAKKPIKKTKQQKALEHKAALERTSRLVRTAQKRVGLNNREFARLIGVCYVSVCRWRTGTLEASGSTTALLRLLAARPTLCVKILGKTSGVQASAKVKVGKP